MPKTRPAPLVGKQPELNAKGVKSTLSVPSIDCGSKLESTITLHARQRPELIGRRPSSAPKTMLYYIDRSSSAPRFR
jgi:hypothetical protein